MEVSPEAARWSNVQRKDTSEPPMKTKLHRSKRGLLYFVIYLIISISQKIPAEMVSRVRGTMLFGWIFHPLVWFHPRILWIHDT